MAITHENKVIEKLLIKQDKYRNQLSMYQFQEKDELLYLALKQLGLIDQGGTHG